MNRLYQYDPYTGGPPQPAYGVTPSHGLLDDLFQTLTRQQILGAFAGNNPGLLDALMNQQQAAAAPAPAPAQPAPVAAEPAPAAQEAAVETVMQMEPEGRNDGYDSGPLYGGDGYGLYANEGWRQAETGGNSGAGGGK